jgi:hypothetical protein
MVTAQEQKQEVLQKPTLDIPSLFKKRSGVLAEFVVSCPNCKTLETLWFINGRLTQTRKFSQAGSSVYHDCGSNQACRIYRMV